MPLDLTGVNAKLSRAKEHTQSVKDEVAAWMNTRPYSLSPKANADFTRWALVISVPKTGNLVRWTLIIGDAINNLRSALDHLVYAIAIHESGQNPPPNDKGLGFPISDTQTKFADDVRRIRTLSCSVRTAIELVQPYNRPHPALPALLAILREFNNADKHKLLRLAYGATSSGDVSFTWKGSRSEQPMPVRVDFNAGELKDGTEVMAATFDRPAPDMQCHFDVTVIIALWHGGKAGIVRAGFDRDDFAAILALLAEEVEAVINLVVAAVK